MSEKYTAAYEIDELIKSEKTHESVEEEATEILSKKLHEYSLNELKNELVLPTERENLDIDVQEKLSPEEMEKNFQKFIEILKQDIKLDFIKDLIKQFPKSKVYLVGGAVRDGFMGRQIKDYDMVLSGIQGDDLEKALSEMGRVDLVGKNFGVYKFKNKENKEYLDLVLPRQEKSGGSGAKHDFEIESNWQLPIKQDLARRDFTINAMALDFDGYKLVDPFGGKEDLTNGIVRSVGNPEKRLSEDLSRILRGIRFAVKMNYQIDNDTWQAIKIKSQEILKIDNKGKLIVPWETISTELEKTFIIDPAKTFNLLNESGLMKQIFPELEKLKGLKQPQEHHKEGDAFVHTKLALKALPLNSPISLIFATLMHDVGKLETFKQDENGKITFYGHAEKSTEITKNICKRLKLKTKLTNKITNIIANHMKIFQIGNMTDATIYKLLFETMPEDETSHELIRLNRADLLASLSEEKASYEIARRKISEFNKKAAEKQLEIKPLINGKDLISLGLKPGPIFNKIINLIRDRQLGGDIKSKEEAIALTLLLIKELINI